MWMAHQSFISVELGEVTVNGKTSGPECTGSESESRTKSKCSCRFSVCSSERILQKLSKAKSAAGE